MTCSTVLTLETHRYAPELNRLHLKNGASIAAPGITSVSQYRQQSKPREFTLMGEVRTVYAEPHKWLERVKIGRVKSRAEALTVLRQIKKGLVPGGRATLRTWIVGA